jgi:hypothetical protein
MLRGPSSSALPAVLAGLLAACQRVPIDQPEVEDSTSSSGSSGVVTDGDGGGDNGDGGGFGPEYQCEPGDPNTCPEGQKCSPLSVGGGPQNKFKCVPDDGELLPGDDCTPAPGTGEDRCSAGAVCLVSDPDDTLGRCLQACHSDEDCGAGKCTQSPFTGTNFCAEPCDPLASSCPQGLVCHQSTDRFICVMPVEVDTGLNGDNCDGASLRGCVENFACLPGALVPGCASGNCCTNTCDLALGDDQCSSPSLCRPMFSDPAPGFEGVGACHVPAS